MAVTVETLSREFGYNGVTLTDPGAQFSPNDVRDLYSATYPELASAEVTGPEKKGDRLVWTFKRAVGTKGAMTMPRTVVKTRADGLDYIEVVPAGTMTLSERIKKLGDGLDALLFGSDLTKATAQALVRH